MVELFLAKIVNDFKPLNRVIEAKIELTLCSTLAECHLYQSNSITRKVSHAFLLRNYTSIYFCLNSILRENCPYSEFFWPVILRIRTECGEIRSIFSYSVRMRENKDQKNSEQGHFSRSAKVTDVINIIYRMIQDFDSQYQNT